jgi:SEC-C motif-containing protein
MNCPCRLGQLSSGQTFDRCCGRFISHRALPENATQLMRSRYSAYVLGERDYLLASWHPDFRPPRLQLDTGIRWLGLDIIASEEHGVKALVEFEASLLVAGEVSALHERSDFVLQQGRWQYTSGQQLTPRAAPWKPTRNQNCPCGSGLKFKRCCNRA